MSGPKKPRSSLGHLSTYGAVPVNGRALGDMPLDVVPDFGEGEKLGTGASLVFHKRSREEYDIEADGQTVGKIKFDSAKAYDKRWEITISVKHYLANPEWPLAGRSVKAAQELLRKHW